MKLKPPENVRETNHRCCMTCKHLTRYHFKIDQAQGDPIDGPCYICARSNEPECDDIEITETICDGYKRKDKS